MFYVAAAVARGRGEVSGGGGGEREREGNLRNGKVTTLNQTIRKRKNFREAEYVGGFLVENIRVDPCNVFASAGLPYLASFGAP